MEAEAMAPAAFDAEAGGPATVAPAGNGAHHHAAKHGPGPDAGAAFVLESKGTQTLSPSAPAP